MIISKLKKDPDFKSQFSEFKFFNILFLKSYDKKKLNQKSKITLDIIFGSYKIIEGNKIKNSRL